MIIQSVIAILCIVAVMEGYEFKTYWGKKELKVD